MTTGVGVGITDIAGRKAGGGPTPPPVDDLEELLIELEEDGKLICAWFLPLDDPDQYLTLNGANVEGWAAAYGTQKVNLAYETAAPQWDASLFDDKGGVAFNGSTQRLVGTGGALANWPDASADLYMGAGVQITNAGATGIRRILSYGSTSTTTRGLGTTGTIPTLAVATIVGSAGDTLASAFPVPSAHAIGLQCDIGGTSHAYVDSTTGAGTSTASGGLTLTRVCMGRSAGSATQFFWGDTAGAFVLNSTASLQDFLDLMAQYAARVQ